MSKLKRQNVCVSVCHKKLCRIRRGVSRAEMLVFQTTLIILNPWKNEPIKVAKVPKGVSGGSAEVEPKAQVWSFVLFISYPLVVFLSKETYVFYWSYFCWYFSEVQFTFIWSKRFLHSFILKGGVQEKSALHPALTPFSENESNRVSLKFFWDFSSVSSTMPSIAFDPKKPDLACTYYWMKY